MHQKTFTGSQLPETQPLSQADRRRRAEAPGTSRCSNPSTPVPAAETIT